MSNSSEKNNLTNIMKSLIEKTEGNSIEFREIVDALENRGFGPLLMAPALLIILPSGAIPGFPAVCSFIILMISLQILIGNNRPWIPKKLGKISFSRKKFKKACEMIEPYARKIDKYVENRFEVFAESLISKRFVAVICSIIAITIIIIGFVPGVPAALASPILFFALGLSVKDGTLMMIGYLIFIGAIIAFIII